MERYFKEFIEDIDKIISDKEITVSNWKEDTADLGNKLAVRSTSLISLTPIPEYIIVEIIRLKMEVWALKRGNENGKS